MLKNDRLCVYLERLVSGRKQEFDELVEPDLLNLSDETLTFQDPVYVKGEAYLAEGWLILHLSVDTKVTVPCSLCNEPVAIDISVKGLIEEEAVETIHGGVFDFSDRIREVVLLEVPFYPQCGGAECSNRKDVEKYLAKNKDQGQDHWHHPFSELL